MSTQHQPNLIPPGFVAIPQKEYTRLLELEAELDEMSGAYLKLNRENEAGKYRIAELLAENEKLNAAYDLMERDFERAERENEKLREIQPCGHPGACISSTDEGTSHCQVCAEIASLKAAPIEEHPLILQLNQWGFWEFLKIQDGRYIVQIVLDGKMFEGMGKTPTEALTKLLESVESV